MKVDIRVVRDIYILDCSGKITLGGETMLVRTTVKELLEKGAKKILLNLAGVTYIDSAGVGELVGSYVTASNSGTKLKLLGLTGKLREVLTITKLLSVFEVFDNETAAVLSFN